MSVKNIFDSNSSYPDTLPRESEELDRGRAYHITVINPPGHISSGWAEVRTEKGSQIVQYSLNDKPDDLLKKVIQSKRQSFFNQVLNLLKKVI